MHLSKISLALRQWGAGAWSPSSLFAAGEQGAWYDPSDLSTMFQNTAGTTPVTADGQPVGLILDKSKGLVLGSEEIDGDFSGIDNWNSPALISGGMLNFASSANNVGVYQSLPSPKNAAFEITVNVPSISSGAVTVTVGIGSPNSSNCYNITTAGIHTFRQSNFGLDNYVRVYAVGASTTASVDNISIKAIAGNHASQATAASRPLYKTDGTYHWLQFDGVDDSLSTAAINFTASTAISSFMGLNKGSSAGGKQFFSTGANPTVSGAFGIYAPNGADLTFAAQFAPIGQGALAGTTASSYATGQKFTLSAFFDAINYSPITSALKVKVNGGSVALTYGGAGAAAASTFGNLPLYVGARESAVIPFTGNMYPLIILGRLATTQEITDTETWVNGKTGAY